MTLILNRRRFLIASGALITAAYPGIILAGKSKEGLEPGDEGYHHDLYHEYYQMPEVFGGHCACGVGDCRGTIARKTQMGSKRKWDVRVNGLWQPLPEDVYEPDKSKIPEDILHILKNEHSHVCAYGDKYPFFIPCFLTFEDPGPV